MAVFKESAIVPAWHEPNLCKYLELLLYFDGVCVRMMYCFVSSLRGHEYCKPIVSSDETGKVNSSHHILDQKWEYNWLNT